MNNDYLNDGALQPVSFLDTACIFFAQKKDTGYQINH